MVRHDERTIREEEISFTEYWRKNLLRKERDFLVSDIFGILDSIRDKNENDYGEKDNDIIINITSSFKNTNIDELTEIMKEFEESLHEYYKELGLGEGSYQLIITSRVAPAFDYIAREEEYNYIRGIDDINGYQISTAMNVIGHDGKLIPHVISDNGPVVLLETVRGTSEYYSVPYLMMQSFQPNMVYTHDDKWELEMLRLISIFGNIGFTDINEYCGFEYSSAHIYNNDVGVTIVEYIANTNTI